ncbi:gp436 family protein [Pseudoduganella sp. RAF53_2]|uniref:gp436 family protein n=1 Tax=unclassified Pseudoduganella TaxID=2637179 RepID=UPI003F9EB87E
MTYAVRSDLEQRYGADEVAQRELMLPAGAVDLALQDADATINGYLGNRYSLPLVTVPANLVQVASALARYSILGDSATDRAVNDFRDAMAWLRDVSAGKVKLQDVVPIPGNEPATVVMATSSPSVFGRNARP